MENFETSARWQQAAFNRETNEWVHTWLESERPAIDPSTFVTQAPPIRITPSKRKRGEIDALERVATVGDLHFPFQNQRRVNLLETALLEIEPTRIDLMGDNLDFANYSRFESRKEWGESTQQGIEEYAQFLGRLVANHVGVEIVWHEGNHDNRMEKRIREYNEDLLGIKPAGEKLEALSLEFLLHLDELGIRMSKGYPSAREIVHDQLELFHGNITGRQLAASKVIEQAFLSFNTGHTHQFGVVAKTYYVGNEQRTIYGAESGTYADYNKTPSGKYAPKQIARHNWQSGIVEWNIYEDGARPSIHTIDDNYAQVGQKRFK